MKSCGIIAEYNPFHRGHSYQIAQARKISQADVVVVVMSGNFLQRGEPAIIDKWQRTKLALSQGADCIVELPFGYAVQAADYFAQGGVSLLQALGVDYLSFGTDYAGEMDYQAFANFQQHHQAEIDSTFKKIQNNGMNYPQQMTKVYRELFPEMALDFSSPNHILGMSYAKENASYEQPMRLLPIKRQEVSHHDYLIQHDTFASGTAIRQAVFKNEGVKVKKVVPDATYQALQSAPLVNWEKLWSLLRYQLLVQPIEELQTIYQMTQGIEYRLKSCAKQATSFESFVDLVKTKRFTWTRIQRLCVYILLQVKAKDVEQFRSQPYLRILGFNDKGRSFLKQQKNKSNMPIITNVNKKNEELLQLDIKAGNIYQMADPHLTAQDYYRKPLYVN